MISILYNIISLLSLGLGFVIDDVIFLAVSPLGFFTAIASMVYLARIVAKNIIDDAKLDQVKIQAKWPLLTLAFIEIDSSAQELVHIVTRILFGIEKVKEEIIEKGHVITHLTVRMKIATDISELIPFVTPFKYKVKK